MPDSIPGIHHVTAIGSDPVRNLEFYTDTLGLRLVKRSVNQDDPGVYHLFYGDYEGSPGTSMTFFPYTGARQGQVGTGDVSTTAFLVPAGSLSFWSERLREAGVEVGTPGERFGDRILSFEDPDGLPVELVAREDAPAAYPSVGIVPDEYAIRGFFGVTIRLTREASIGGLLEEMGFTKAASQDDRVRFESDGELGWVVDLDLSADGDRGSPGAGTVHHVAFQVTRDTQEAWRQTLIDRGLRPTQVVDRKWFDSVYVRLPSGPLFEFATAEPGYTVDEPLESLGDELLLPERLEDRRSEIESALPELQSR